MDNEKKAEILAFESHVVSDALQRIDSARESIKDIAPEIATSLDTLVMGGWVIRDRMRKARLLLDLQQ